MQNIDENMDHLFRKAAEHYTPKPDEDGWDAIRQRLSPLQVEAVIPLRNSSSLKKIMLLLLLITFVATDYYYSHSDSVLVKQTASSTIAKSQKKEAVKADHTIDYLLASDEVKTVKQPGTKRNDFIKNKQLYNKLNSNAIFFMPRKRNAETIANIDFDKEKKSEIAQSDSDSGVALDKKTEESISNPTKIDSDQTAQAKTQILNKKESKLYLGFSTGLSINQVQQQGYQKAGLDAGFFAGYKLNKKLSVEGGLQYDKKYYFSDGKYFSMDKMPANMKVVSLKGSSRVIEVPLTVKYDVLKTKKAAAFVSAGVSSYLLTKESNQYIMLVNGTQQNMNGLYKHISGGIASSLHVGFGYEKPINKSVIIRIEPYANIPIKGTGIGNMRVMTAGLHIAATLPVH